MLCSRVTQVLKDWLRIPVPPNEIYYIQGKLEIERVGKFILNYRN